MAVFNALTPATALGAIVVGLVSVLAFLLIRASLQSRRPQNFPPGPSTVPVLGNLLALPTSKSFLKFREWGRQYGDIIGLKLGRQNMVVLNNYKHVAELFDRKGGIYSSRPPNYVANEILFPNGAHLLYLPSGDRARALRKALSDVLRTTEADKWIPLQSAESIQTMYDLLKDPDRWYDHIRRYSTSVILASVFGLRGATFDSPRVKELYRVQDQHTAISELGATPPLDIFPFLSYLPDFMSPWRVWARQIRVEYQALLRLLVRECKESGNTECFLAKLLQEQDKNGLNEELIAHLGTGMMEAGSDTTASTLLSFLLAMTTHQIALKKCQAEVDAQCGLDRSPTIEDARNLPFLTAVMEETLRWRPVAPAGIPHMLTQDDTYKGYFFPKGTIFFANTWAIHRTDEFDSPDEFIPERFLENKFGIKPGQDSGDDKRRYSYIWGAGRRVCSGQRLAENSLLINMAKLVWAFDIKPDGEIDDSVERGYSGGFLIAPKKFPLTIRTRSPAHAAIIERELEEVKPFFAQFKE